MIVNYIKLIGSVFMGWSLGSNHSANVFGAAVASKAIRYKNAILLCALFVIIGAFIGGASGIKTLSSIITQNLDTALITTVAAATTVLIMTILKIPVSTSQAMVCAIIGIGLSSSQPINLSVLPKILIVWVGTPTGAILVACILYPVLKFLLDSLKLDIFKRDFIIKIGLIIVSCYAAYALGANNVANVIGVFVPVAPFKAIAIGNFFYLSSAQQLFALGGIAIGIGVFTYSKKVMETVGGDIVELSPLTALITVLASSTVLFLFASIELKTFLESRHLPSFPLVPVSSSQSIVGAVIGIGLAKNGGKNINFGILGKISMGWLITPIMAGLFSFVMLFVVSNVFEQPVYKKITYTVKPEIIQKLKIEDQAILTELKKIENQTFKNEVIFDHSLKLIPVIKKDLKNKIIVHSRDEKLFINPAMTEKPDFGHSWKLTQNQIDALKKLTGQTFIYRWQLDDALTAISDDWKFRENKDKNIIDTTYNNELKDKYDVLYRRFSILE